MHRIFRLIAIILLLFNAIPALFGGWALMTDPSGESLEMTLSILEHSPFENFLVPGIILFVTNGLLSLLFAVSAMLRFMNYAWLVIFQGFILLGWLVVQIIMIREFNASLHGTYFCVGLLLIATGWILARQDQVIYQSH